MNEKEQTMKTIWEDERYMAHNFPPYLPTKAGWGRESYTVFFFYGITPKGNVSHYWVAYYLAPHFSRKEKLRRLKNYILNRRPNLRKGYTWSESQLYAGHL